MAGQSFFKTAESIENLLKPLEPESQKKILGWVAESLGIDVGGDHSSQTAMPNTGSTVAQSPTPAVSGSVNQGDERSKLRSFIKTKSPATDVERVACLAFFLAHSRNTPIFTRKDLTQLATVAGETFSNFSYTLANASRQSRFLVSAGGRNWQLTSHGEDVVNALPDRDAVKKVTSARPRRKKRKSKKTSATKK